MKHHHQILVLEPVLEPHLLQEHLLQDTLDAFPDRKHGFAPLLDPVGAWLNEGSAVESTLAGTWAQTVDVVAQRLWTRFPGFC